VSLHAADDALRKQLVAASGNTSLAEILAAADRYFVSSGRRLTFEYVLLSGVNDRPEQARSLARLLGGRGVLLNVIPYNPVDGLPYETPSPSAVAQFREQLQSCGVNVQVRFRKGDKIAAACGQLRRLHAAALM
jgi:23S rRNA (adenine2503-C2)-methyltransferase